jgi:hypothetical protein
MAAKQDCVAALSRNQQLSIAEMTGRQIGVDDDPITPVSQTQKLIMGKTKAPVLGVIGGTIGYPFWSIGQRMEMRARSSASGMTASTGRLY